MATVVRVEDLIGCAMQVVDLPVGGQELRVPDDTIELSVDPAQRLELDERPEHQPAGEVRPQEVEEPADHPLDLLAAPVADRRFVGKNVCHTVVYDAAVHATMPPAPSGNPAAGLFRLAMDLYPEGHPGKKWHDPTAAVCHLHPEVGTWVRGRVTKLGGGWGTVADPAGDLILADIDRDALWHHFRTWT